MIVIGPTTVVGLWVNPRAYSSGELNLQTRNQLSFEPAADGLKPTFDDLSYRNTLANFAFEDYCNFATGRFCHQSR